MDEQLLNLLCVNAYQGYSASTNGTESGQRAFDWYKNLSAGNLVMEISTISTREHDRNRIGKLMAVGDMGEYFIQTLDGRTFAWSNADFIRVPEKMFEIR